MRLLDFLVEYREAVTEFNEDQKKLEARRQSQPVRKFRPKRHR